MDKEKQIKEIAELLYGYSIDTQTDCEFVAEQLYNANCRKQSEIAKDIITDLKEAFKPLTADRLYEYPRSSHKRLNDIVEELVNKYIKQS